MQIRCHTSNDQNIPEMETDPILQSLRDELGLTLGQAQGVVGVLLVKLREKLPPADFYSFLQAFPDANDWMKLAPPLPPLKKGGFMLPALEKAQLLLQMNQALNALQIPSSKAQQIGRVLTDSIRAHHPHLEDVVRQLL